ncbi:phage tail tape measure C-terminal domain-containing protein [Bordetella sp. LUAb4]|uniref:phage tail tape measure C-terminal domain-containing protein n=1 Tax=Bordetella sp. LUAb4 TaxID=2843195 RepID=UPI001E5DD066|nr:phage tail tape measure C-terminal domain-containing protein [Bordetella sp. LUAb4]
MSLRNVTTTSNLQTTRAMEVLATSLKNVTKAATALTAAANSASKGSGAAGASKGAAAGGDKAAGKSTAVADADKKKAEDDKKPKTLAEYAKKEDVSKQLSSALGPVLETAEKQGDAAIATGKLDLDPVVKQLESNLARVSIQDIITKPLAKGMDDLLSKMFKDWDKKDKDKDKDDASGGSVGSTASGGDNAGASGTRGIVDKGEASKEGSKDGDKKPGDKEGIKTLDDYVEHAGSAADSINKVFTNTFGSLEDQLVSFVTTGKANFKGLADSLINDLAHVALQQGLSGLASGLSSVIGSAVSSFGFASGGYTGAGGKYEEKGVVHGGEYVFDKDSTQRLGVSYLDGLRSGAPQGADGGAGAIVIAQAPASGGININTNITVAGGSSDDGGGGEDSADAKQLGTMINQQVRSVLVQESRQGGLLWNMRNGYGK